MHLQPDRSPELNLSEAIARLARLADDVRVTEGEDERRYVSVDFKTTDLPGLWSAIRAVVQSLSGLAGAAIIVCEGEHGWDDYLLLHHFDPSEKLDELPAKA
jgi:hypothetical protein